MTVVDVAPKLLILYSCKVVFFLLALLLIISRIRAELSLVSENFSNYLLEHVCNTIHRLNSS